MRARIAAAGLSLSAAALVGLLAHEGFTGHAVIPVQGDRPTVGFGSTFREDGRPVQLGDTITPQKAVARTHAPTSRCDAMGPNASSASAICSALAQRLSGLRSRPRITTAS